METLQSSTNIDTSTELGLRNVESGNRLNLKQEEFISYKAVSGMIVEVGDTVKTMTMKEFADYIGVDRKTLYNWQKTIPNFWQLVKDRRQSVFSRDRVSKVWSRVYVDAISGKVEQQKLFLGQFDGWKPPAQKNDVQISGFADLINLARRRKAEEANRTNKVVEIA